MTDWEQLLNSLPGDEGVLFVMRYLEGYTSAELEIRPGTQEVLASYATVFVNGPVLCPASLAPFLTNFSVNGSTNFYPDDCTVLDPVFTPDAWSPLRARQEGHYYVSRQLRLTEKIWTSQL